jgi:hypothetical protein
VQSKNRSAQGLAIAHSPFHRSGRAALPFRLAPWVAAGYARFLFANSKDLVFAACIFKGPDQPIGDVLMMAFSVVWTIILYRRFRALSQNI